MPAPLPKAFWPLIITAGANDTFYVQIAGLRLVTIAAGTYYSAAALAEATRVALQAAYANTWSVTISATGRVTIAGAASFTLADQIQALGFVSGSYASGLSVTGEAQHQNGWYADDPVADDTGNLPGYERAAARALGGQTRAVDFGTVYDRVITLDHLPGHKVFKADEGANLNEALERLFDSGWARFRWWPDASDEPAFQEYLLAPDTAKALTRQRLSPGHARYALSLRLWKWVG